MTNYKDLNTILPHYFDGITNLVTILSNASALINDYVCDINWAGFYLFEDGKLVLGPFQGKVACMEIKLGKGVCGTAALNRETIVVDNVHEFKGHIACDSRSNSEIVIPLIINDNLFGVLDIDSTSFSRFKDIDKYELEIFASNLCKIIKKIID